MARRICLALALASLAFAMLIAPGCGGGAAPDGEGMQEGKAQVLLFTTPT